MRIGTKPAEGVYRAVGSNSGAYSDDRVSDDWLIRSFRPLNDKSVSRSLHFPSRLVNHAAPIRRGDTACCVIMNGGIRPSGHPLFFS